MKRAILIFAVFAAASFSIANENDDPFRKEPDTPAYRLSRFEMLIQNIQEQRDLLIRDQALEAHNPSLPSIFRAYPARLDAKGLMPEDYIPSATRMKSIKNWLGILELYGENLPASLHGLDAKDVPRMEKALKNYKTLVKQCLHLLEPQAEKGK